MCGALLLLALAIPGEESPFTDVVLDEPFRPYLLANRVLMETTGAKVVRLPDGNYLLLGVASAPLDEDSPRARAAAEKVCREAALRDVVATTQGVQIASVQKAEDRLVVTVEKGESKVKSISSYLEITTTRVAGMAREMPVVGRWRSRDGRVLYVVTGVVCDRSGNLVQTDPLAAAEAGRDTAGGVATVVATGTGQTDTEAEKDALCAAVRQVAGALVDAQTQVKNERLIRDKVLTFSDGLVSDYQVLETRRDAGLVVKKIRARVERGQVISKLRASSITLTAFDGKEAFARIVAQIETEKQARRFIRELFQTYPRNVLTGRAVGDPHVPPGKPSETENPLAYKVAVSVDPERYEAFVAKTLEVLRRAAVRSGSCSLRGASVAPDGKVLASFVAGAVAAVDGEMSTVHSILRPPLPASYPADYEWWNHWEWWGKGFDPQTDMVFVVNTERSEKDDRLDFTWFHVPAVDLPLPALRLVIRLVDEDGKEIKQDVVALGPNFPGFNLSRREMDSKKGGRAEATTVILSPYLVGGLRYCRQVVLNRQVNLSLDELRRVRGVRCKIGSPEEKDEEEIVVHKTVPVRIDPPPSPPPPPPPAIEAPEKIAAGHLARAEAHRLRGEHDKAIAAYTSALASNPRSAPAFAGRGAAYHAGRQWERAIADCTEAIRLDPKNALAHALRGDARRRQGDFDPALADCDRAIWLDGKSVLAHSARGFLRLRAGELDRAIADCDEAIRLDPKVLLAYEVRAEAQRRKGDLDRAIADCDKAIGLDPDDVPAHATRGAAYRAKGSAVKALADCDTAIRLDPGNVLAHATRAALYHAGGDQDKALAECDEMIRLDSRSASAHFLRGTIRQARGELDQSLQDCSRAIELDPQMALAHATRGETYRRKGELDRAIADCDEAIRLDPNSAAAYAARGNAQRQKASYDRAIADCNEAIRLDPNNAFAHAARADAYRCQFKLDQALADCDRSLALRPGNAFVYAVRGDTYRRKGELDRAIADCDEAIRLEPDSVLARSARGAAYHGKGDWARAIADLDRAIRLDPRYTLAYAFRGDAYLRQGDLDRAIADCGKAIELGARWDFPYARRGDAYRRKGDLDKALADCDSALQIESGSAGTLGLRGEVYRLKGDLDRALADLNEAIRIDPQLASAYESRSQVYRKKGTRYLFRARADHKEAMRLDPSLGKK
jgi:tetratricopeptide (TPR) repeat protein